jgi:hypothetical protein
MATPSCCDLGILAPRPLTSSNKRHEWTTTNVQRALGRRHLSADLVFDLVTRVLLRGSHDWRFEMG